MNKRNLLLFIFLFFSKIFVIKCTDDPEKDGRYYACNDLKLFNQEYLDLVKEYLKENKNERFYLFDVNELNLNYEYEVVKEDGNKETKSEEKIIYQGSLTFNNSNIVGNNQDSTFVIFKDNFDNEDNSKYLQYCNTIPNKISNKIIKEDNKYKILSINPVHKCGDIENNKTDKPIIFKITYNDGNIKKYFCSNIEFIKLYNIKHKGKEKQISLFKNDKIKKVEIIEYFFSNGDKSYECDYIFYNCTNLEEINLDTNDKEISLYGKSMFSECTNLKKITMTKIYNNDPKGFEFNDCTKLKELILNKDFYLGVSGCRNCKNLKTIKFVDDDGNPFKDSISCNEKCFKNCENLENIEVENILINSPNTKDFFYNCKKLKVPKIIIRLIKEDSSWYNFSNMFYGINKEKNDKITLQFNRDSKKDNFPDFDYDKVFNGCDVEKKDVIIKTLDGKEKKLENITKDDEIEQFMCFPDNYIKLRDLYQDAYDGPLLLYLNSKFESKQSKEEIEKEYNEFKKQHENNNKITDQKTEEVNVDKNLGKCGSCGLLFTKCCCCCKK